MEDVVYISSLYDCYNKLLTDKQREYFEDYYFNNLTLSEISENNNVSRNAVHKQIKEVLQKLYNYEELLNLVSKKEKILNIIKDERIKEEIKELIEGWHYVWQNSVY